MSAARKTRLYHKLQLAAHQVQKAVDRKVVEASELTTAQASVLNVVAGFSSCKQKMVAQQLGLNESAITAMVTRLIRDGYLSRNRAQTDARTWLLSLTPKGRDALGHVAAPFGAANTRLETALTDAEIVQLADMLKRVTDAFEDPDNW